MNRSRRTKQRRIPLRNISSARVPRRALLQLGRQVYDEKKQYAASAASGAVYDGAGFILHNFINGIAQGASDSQRNGDHLHLDSINVHINLANGLGATANPAVCYRIIVFQFFGDNNTVPAPASMLLTSSMNGGATYGTFSFLNVDYLEQYRVLYDTMSNKLANTEPYKLFTVGSAAQAVNGSAGGDGITRYLSFSVPLGKADRNIRFYAGGAFGSNHIYLLVTTDQQTIATNPQCSYGYTVRFTDA